ncbi:uncharacterized protein LOC122296847 [Carya illinoinensis]|uniref:uncharacterized protein LOC122296847 n=1 Tax=Carya illinoinensis TaxID=32201 RepID=UPI001C718D6A|nr:uncharacterized protein LOC122296847 [Carya illinoinensis]
MRDFLQLSFPSLEVLHLRDLPRIKHVWSKEIFRFQDFPVLLHFHVKGCESLESLFPAASVATSLPQLKSLKIVDYGVMEEIVAGEDRTDPTTRLLFPSLNVLRLDGLLNLKWFYQRVRTLESSSSKELHEQGGTLFEEVAFPNLTNLDLCGLPKIKHVWSKDPQTILRFQDLKEINVRECASLKSLFPASVGGLLKQLESIRINDCGVEEIVGAEGEEAVGRTLVFEFPRVTRLHLTNLPRLECFYNGEHTSKWPMLRNRLIDRCEKVEKAREKAKFKRDRCLNVSNYQGMKNLSNGELLKLTTGLAQPFLLAGVLLLDKLSRGVILEKLAPNCYIREAERIQSEREGEAEELLDQVELASYGTTPVARRSRSLFLWRLLKLQLTSLADLNRGDQVLSSRRTNKRRESS